MYCPSCHAEYRDVAARCSDCDVPLSPVELPRTRPRHVGVFGRLESWVTHTGAQDSNALRVEDGDWLEVSSASTALYKYAEPVIVAAVFGWIVKSQYETGVRASRDWTHPGVLAWLLFVTWVVSLIAVIRTSAALKRVFVDEEFLYVSDINKNFAIALESVTRVRPGRLSNGKIVVVEFDHETPFGSRVCFAARWGKRSWLTLRWGPAAETVALLERLIREAQAKSRR